MTELTFWLLGFICGAGVSYSIGKYVGSKKVADVVKKDIENLKNIINKQ